MNVLEVKGFVAPKAIFLDRHQNVLGRPKPRQQWKLKQDLAIGPAQHPTPLPVASQDTCPFWRPWAKHPVIQGVPASCVRIPQYAASPGHCSRKKSALGVPIQVADRATLQKRKAVDHQGTLRLSYSQGALLEKDVKLRSNRAQKIPQPPRGKELKESPCCQEGAKGKGNALAVVFDGHGDASINGPHNR